MKSQQTEANTAKNSKQTIEIKEPGLADTFETVKLHQGDEYTSDPYATVYEDPGTLARAGSSIPGQFVAYFSERADVVDMDMLSFSLHHLFCRVDFLYRVAPAGLAEQGDRVGVPLIGTRPYDRLLHQHQVWNQLQAVRRTLHRIEPLCHLLSDATECILNALDLSSEITLPMSTLEKPLQQPSQDEQSWLHAIKQERWAHALASLNECLEDWQLHQHTLTPFFTHFANLVSAIPALERLEGAFDALLDSAGSIYSDILPGFQAISVGEDETAATLLFDLMQQSDQILSQLEIIEEPLDALLEHFTVETTMSQS